jgi:aminoglycoside phosphotransferase family enzyme/predicted kinase
MDQTAVVAFIAAALARETGAPVETKQTHVSLLFLAGDLVFKLKKAIVFPYLDFSTPALREKACRAELALNSRAAPDLYLGVRRITQEPGGLAFDGPGPLVDCIVVMRRFEEASLFDAMAREGRLTPAHIEALAAKLANFHASAQRFREVGGAEVFAHLLDLNEDSFAHCGIFAQREIDRLNARFRAELKELAALLDARALAGFVRLCHGDLYLRNICLFQGRPTLFDCIEFDPRLAQIDVLYDVAFTLMDLWLLGRHDLANLLFNRYVSALSRTVPDMPAKTRDGYAALPFFMALRAAIRAHIAASQAHSGNPESNAALEREARAYFALAEDLLTPRPNVIVAIGGLSGTGKSTLSAAIAGDIGAPPGARMLNSDRTRKAMHRIAPTDRLPAAAYEINITGAVYLRLLSRAMDAWAQGRSIVLDAVYSTEEERDAVAKLARESGAPFVGIWLDAPPEVLRRRVRERPHGVSDADLSVLEGQLARDVGRVDWIRLDATLPDLPGRVLEIIRIAFADNI